MMRRLEDPGTELEPGVDNALFGLHPDVSSQEERLAVRCEPQHQRIIVTDVPFERSGQFRMKDFDRHRALPDYKASKDASLECRLGKAFFELHIGRAVVRRKRLP